MNDQKTNIGIVGDRNFNDKNYIKAGLLTVCEENKIPINEIMIVSGGAKGVDKNAIIIANELKCQNKEYLPDYEKFGRGAPIIRNKQIIENSDLVIAFPTKESKGTRNSISVAKENNKPCYVFEVKTIEQINEGFEVRTNPLLVGENRMGELLVKLRDFYRNSSEEQIETVELPAVCNFKLFGHEIQNYNHTQHMKKFYVRLAFDHELALNL
jgi:hypothetical protein